MGQIFMSKAKKGSTNALSELHFISSMSLEEALHHMRNLPFDVTVTQITPDRYKVVIKDQANYARVKGTLRRWQGTQTRVDIGGGTPASEPLSVAVMLGGAVFIFGAMALVVVLTLTDNVQLFFGGVVGLILIALLLSLTQPKSRDETVSDLFKSEQQADYERELEQQRDASKLLDQIIPVFSQNSQIELLD